MWCRVDIERAISFKLKASFKQYTCPGKLQQWKLGFFKMQCRISQIIERICRKLSFSSLTRHRNLVKREKGEKRLKKSELLCERVRKESCGKLWLNITTGAQVGSDKLLEMRSSWQNGAEIEACIFLPYHLGSTDCFCFVLWEKKSGQLVIILKWL